MRLVRHPKHEGAVDDLAVSPDGALGASVGVDGWLRVSRAAGGALVGELDLGLDGDRGTRVAFVPAGAARRLAVGTARGAVLVIEVRGGP